MLVTDSWKSHQLEKKSLTQWFCHQHFKIVINMTFMTWIFLNRKFYLIIDYVMKTTVVWQSVTLFLTLVRHIFQFFQSYYRIINVVKIYNRRLTMGLSLYWRSDENVRLYGKLKLLLIRLRFIVDHGAQNFIGRFSRTLVHSSYVWAQKFWNVYGIIWSVIGT